MSWQATVWAASLPHSRVSGVPFRVLMLLADHAHDDGTAAWRSVESIAATLEVSERTVHRAFADLREPRDRDGEELPPLIRYGDQALLSHLPINRRPMVYDLCMFAASVRRVPETQDVGVTELSPHPAGGAVDNGSGVTTVVADIRKNPPLTIKSSKGDHTGAVTPSARCAPRRGKPHVVSDPSEFCAACGVRPADGARMDLGSGRVTA